MMSEIIVLGDYKSKKKNTVIRKNTVNLLLEESLSYYFGYKFNQ